MRPEQSLAPYDESLKGRSRAEIWSWSGRVLDGLDALGLDYRRTVFEIHAGDEYRSFGLVDGLLMRGARVEVPAEGLSQGRQLAFYAAGGLTATPVQKVADAYAVRTPAVRAASGSYGALTEFLLRSTASRVELTFRELEAVIGRSLPVSATKYRAWWANERAGSHSHARSWLSAGCEVDTVNFTSAKVIFRRTG